MQKFQLRNLTVVRKNKKVFSLTSLVPVQVERSDLSVVPLVIREVEMIW